MNEEKKTESTKTNDEITPENIHQFHIPVMGTAFTIDTPLKVAKFGISSVISLCDDELCENMREYYSKLYNFKFESIKKRYPDYRAKRMTAYLDLVKKIVDNQIKKIKELPFNQPNDLNKYFELLPTNSPLKKAYRTMQNTTEKAKKSILQNQLKEQVQAGPIDVNIMTKLDKQNKDQDNNPLDDIFSDALAALRGFAQSKLNASIVFSAGFNRRLYAYIAEFKDFFPTKTNDLKKRIVLKVSDYRSCLTQGKFLAKKGIWISEYRIESGLNCGGHAFATDGLLLGPILQEIKDKKEDLFNNLFKTCNDTLQKINKTLFKDRPKATITVQGGIGTKNEQEFLLNHYQVDRTGWATPFLLVPEVTNVDDNTRQQLVNAKQEDLYLSGISPLGVKFNTMKGTQSEQQKENRIKENKPGSPCPKGYLVSNTEFSKKPVCTASIFYQKRKLAELNDILSDQPSKLKIETKKVLAKACLCEDLAASSLIINQINNNRPLATAICPGPNLAFFSKIVTLSEMVCHIYGKINILNKTYRPHMFINELKMYINYLIDDASEKLETATPKQIKELKTFKNNILEGIQYYINLIPKISSESKEFKDKMLTEVLAAKETLFNNPILIKIEA